MRAVKEDHVNYTKNDSFEEAYRRLKHWLEVTYMTEQAYPLLDYLTLVELEMEALTSPRYFTLNSGLSVPEKPRKHIQPQDIVPLFLHIKLNCDIIRKV